MIITRREFTAALALTGAAAAIGLSPLRLISEASAQTAADVAKPVSLPDMALGPKEAAVTVVEFASMTCGHCANFNETVFPKIKTEFIDTGKIRDEIRAIVPRLTEIGAMFGATPAQVALAFAVMNPATTSVLFGATRKSQLDDNVKALQLANEHGAELKTLLAPLAVAGHENDAPYQHAAPLTGDFIMN